MKHFRNDGDDDFLRGKVDGKGVLGEGDCQQVYYRKPYSTVFGKRGEGAMYEQRTKLAYLGQLLVNGMSIRAAARKACCSKNTAKKLYNILCAELIRRGSSPIKCACGQLSIHQGWCSHRFAMSESRQKYYEGLANEREK